MWRCTVCSARGFHANCWFRGPPPSEDQPLGENVPVLATFESCDHGEWKMAQIWEQPTSRLNAVTCFVFVVFFMFDGIAENSAVLWDKECVTHVYLTLLTYFIIDDPRTNAQKQTGMLFETLSVSRSPKVQSELDLYEFPLGVPVSQHQGKMCHQV